MRHAASPQRLTVTLPSSEFLNDPFAPFLPPLTSSLGECRLSGGRTHGIQWLLRAELV